MQWSVFSEFAVFAIYKGFCLLMRYIYNMSKKCSLDIILFCIKFWYQLPASQCWEDPPGKNELSISETKYFLNTCACLSNQLSEGKTQWQLSQCAPLFGCGWDSLPRSGVSPEQRGWQHQTKTWSVEALSFAQPPNLSGQYRLSP